MSKYLRLNTSTGRLETVTAVQTSAGSGDADKLIRLDAAGKLDSSFMPAGFGGSTQTIVASENLAAGDAVNIYDNAGTKTVRKANATDTTKPCNGFVLSSVTSAANATVYFDGQNTAIPVGSYVAADIGKRVFLSTSSGLYTLTPPSTTGNLVQVLGYIVDVGSTVTIDFSGSGVEIVA